MNILVIGCGTVGAQLAEAMCAMGHDVSVIDRNEESFELLDSTFRGMTITGNPIDQDFLRRAGIEGCDAVAAMTSNDNVNVMVSQIAKELFHVPKVLTRVHDPKRESIFASFGLHTICPTTLTVDTAVSSLLDRREPGCCADDRSLLWLSTGAVTTDQQGDTPASIRTRTGERPIAVYGLDRKLELADPGRVLMAGELLVLARPVNGVENA